MKISCEIQDLYLQAIYKNT